MDEFAKLPASDRSLAFAEVARRRQVTPLVIEKDFWSCWMLRRLFALADPPAALVFKGGTSLSKVYGAIDLDPDDADGQAVLFRYPALAARAAGGYLKPRVKLEFGGRGDQEPCERAAVVPYVAEELPDALPDATTDVTVLRADRTFWEKATILHMLHHRPAGKPLPPAMSRHYYDLALLARHPMGERALAEPGLLAEVAAHKRVFFAAAWARYEAARPGSLRLVPPPARVPELRRDYEQMRAEMTFGDAPDLDALLVELAKLEARING